MTKMLKTSVAWLIIVFRIFWQVKCLEKEAIIDDLSSSSSLSCRVITALVVL